MIAAQPHQPTPPQLAVIAWPDPAVQAVGHRPGSAYIEGVWLGVLGPSATWAWQRLARLAATGTNQTVDTVDLAVSLGLGANLGPNAAISRTLGRLVAFGVAERADAVIAVRTALPDLPARHTGRLSATARLAHQHLPRRHTPNPAGAHATAHTAAHTAARGAVDTAWDVAQPAGMSL